MPVQGKLMLECNQPGQTEGESPGEWTVVWSRNAVGVAAQTIGIGVDWSLPAGLAGLLWLQKKVVLA